MLLLNKRLFYIAIHQVSLLSHALLSHAACASLSTTTTTTRDRGDRCGSMEWAQKALDKLDNGVYIQRYTIVTSTLGFELALE